MNFLHIYVIFCSFLFIYKKNVRYVDVEEESGTELFYYFVESERSPRTDPVLLWLTGGPRCSAFCGFAFEIGQYFVAAHAYIYYRCLLQNASI